MAGSTHVVTAKYVLADGSPARGVVEFVPSAAVTDGVVIVLPAALRVELDNQGEIRVELAATDDPTWTPHGWVWSVSERLAGGRSYNITLTEDIDLATAAPAVVPGDYVALVPVARLVATGPGLTGGGNLAADRTIGVDLSVIASQEDLSGEADARAAADTSLADAIGGVGDDLATLQGALSGEVAARSAADTSLADAIGAVGDLTATKVPLSALTAQSLLGAVTAGVPAALTVPASTLVGRAATGDIAALTPAVVRALLSVVGLSTVGNLLTANVADTTTTLGTTEGFVPSNSVLSSDTTSPVGVDRSLKVEAAVATPSYARLLIGTTSSAGSAFPTNGTIPVQAGQPYTLRFDSDASAAWAGVNVTVYWWSASQAALSNTITPITVTGAVTTTSITLVAPAGAAFASFRIYGQAPAIGATMRLARMGFWCGAGGSWVRPGFVVPSLGLLTTHPNTDDVLVQRWDSGLARWQTIWADTGRRSLTLANSWTATSAILRRTSGGVELDLVGLNGASASSGTVVTLDAGFRPPYALTFTVGTTAAGLPAHVVTVNTNGTVVVGGTYTAVTAGSVAPKFNCEATWPTSLQGTLVAAAPA